MYFFAWNQISPDKFPNLHHESETGLKEKWFLWQSSPGELVVFKQKKTLSKTFCFLTLRCRLRHIRVSIQLLITTLLSFKRNAADGHLFDQSQSLILVQFKTLHSDHILRPHPNLHFASLLQRLTRERPSSLRSTWKRSPKWKRRWARDHPPSPRAKSSQASQPPSARTGQQGLHRWLSAPCCSNRGKEVQWQRTACWTRTSMSRWPLSCWLNSQVILLFCADNEVRNRET